MGNLLLKSINLPSQRRKNYIWIQCSQGRPYLEKQQRDRIEMLFWLEEERKAHRLQKLGLSPRKGAAQALPIGASNSINPHVIRLEPLGQGAR